MNSAWVKLVPRLIRYMMKAKYGSHVMTISLMSALVPGCIIMSSTAPQQMIVHT